MKPPDFEYAQPTTLAEAVTALAGSGGDGKVLAGGQSLVPLLNFRLAAPTLLVDLNHVEELTFLDAGEGELRIGAMTRTRALELDPIVRQTIPLLHAAAGWVGHVQIRNRGTVGGSLAHADPAAELPAACLLLDAEVTARGPRGDRRIALDDLLAGFLTTTLGENEILTTVQVPIPAQVAGWGFQEFAPRRGDFALAGAAAVLEPVTSGALTGKARIVVFGTADRPHRATAAEELLASSGWAPDDLAKAAATAADAAAADDTRADAGYRRHLTETLARRALEDAVTSLTGGSAQASRAGRAA